MFYPVGSDHVLQERGASDFSPVWKGIFKCRTMPITKRNFAVRPADKPPDNLQSFFFEPEKHPAIRVPYFRPIPSYFPALQAPSPSIPLYVTTVFRCSFYAEAPAFWGGTMTQAGSGQYEKVIACYRNNSMQNFFALPLVHHPGPLRALRVGLWGYPGPWGNPESQTGGRFPSAYTKHGSI